MVRVVGKSAVGLRMPCAGAAAMNTAMWQHPAVQRNCLLLQDPRVLPLQPEGGLLACDRIGTGRMADPGQIELAAASVLLQSDAEGTIARDWQGRHVVVSAGPTQEELDRVRVVSNRSSGRMGVLLAQAARLRGASVDLVHGPLQVLSPGWRAALPSGSVERGDG